MGSGPPIWVWLCLRLLPGFPSAEPLLLLPCRRLHAAGVEVLLDVAYNHTAEGDDNDPYLISLRGLENNTYYMMAGGHVRKRVRTHTCTYACAPHLSVRARAQAGPEALCVCRLGVMGSKWAAAHLCCIAAGLRMDMIDRELQSARPPE